MPGSPPPAIQSIGPPPDLHAERVCGEMIRWLHAEHKRLRARGNGLIDVRQMGAPQGQLRVAERLRKALGPLALNVMLILAKRGKFTLGVTEWRVWDPAANAPVPAGALAPPAAWLAAALNIYSAVGYRPASQVLVPLLVSRHACVRLAQRADVRTAADLVTAMRDLWRVIWDLVGQHNDDWLDPPGGAWLVPIREGELSPVVVLERDRSGAKRLVAKTILDREMVDERTMLTHAPAVLNMLPSHRLGLPR
jgi:hypothetical protein